MICSIAGNFEAENSLNLAVKAGVGQHSPVIGTLRSNDADGNENVKKTNWFDKQNNNFARASRFFVHFFPVFARLRRENA